MIGYGGRSFLPASRQSQQRSIAFYSVTIQILIALWTRECLRCIVLDKQRDSSANRVRACVSAAGPPPPPPLWADSDQLDSSYSDQKDTTRLNGAQWSYWKPMKGKMNAERRGYSICRPAHFSELGCYERQLLSYLLSVSTRSFHTIRLPAEGPTSIAAGPFVTLSHPVMAPSGFGPSNLLVAPSCNEGRYPTVSYDPSACVSI